MSQYLALGLGVAVWVLLGVGVRLSWLRARWRSFVLASLVTPLVGLPQVAGPWWWW